MSNRSGEVTLEDGRSLSSLRVVDLKEELEKRSLSKSGSKKELLDRLKKHVLVEKQRLDAGRSDGLPNISMQDKLAEQNPFIREYFESQAQEFHSQTVVKELYQEERERTLDDVEVTEEEPPAPAPAPAITSVVQKMVTLDPVPQEEEVPKEPPSVPAVETKGRRNRSPRVQETLTENEAEAPAPSPSPAVENKVTLDLDPVPVPQHEKVQAKPEKPPTVEIQVFARKSSVKELEREPEVLPASKTIDTDEKKVLVPIPEETKKEQPPKRRRRFDVMEVEPPAPAPALAPAPAPAPAIEKVTVDIDPVPQEEEIPKEPPLVPVIETKGRRNRSPRIQGPIIENEAEAPAPAPSPSSAVENKVTLDLDPVPIPQDEKVQPKPQKPPTVEIQTFARKSSVKELEREPEVLPASKTIDTDEKKELVPIPEETKKEEQPTKRRRRFDVMHVEAPAPALAPTIEKLVTLDLDLDPVPQEVNIQVKNKEPIAVETPGHVARLRRRFEETPAEIVDTPIPAAPVEKKKVTLDIDPAPLPLPLPVSVSVSVSVSQDEIVQVKPKDILKDRKRRFEERHIEKEVERPVRVPIRMTSQQELHSEKKEEHPVRIRRSSRSQEQQQQPPHKEKELEPPVPRELDIQIKSKDVLKDRKRRFEEHPSKKEKEHSLKKEEERPLKKEKEHSVPVRRSSRSQEQQQPSGEKEVEPPVPPEVDIQIKSKDVLKDRKRRFEFEEHSLKKIEEHPLKKEEEHPLKKEEEHPIPVRRSSHSQEQKLKVKRTISIRSGEGIDEDALDYGDEDKDRKEPQKFIWTPRILRLNSNFNNNKSEKTTGGSSPSWKKEKVEDDDSMADHNTYISSGVLVTFFPEADLISESELKLESDKSPSRSEGSSLQNITRTITNETEDGEEDMDEDEEGQEQGHSHGHNVDNNGDIELEPKDDDLRNKVDLSLKRKISINPLPNDEIEKELTPPRHTLSNIIIVTNLVRPFTVIQLRELLQRTGNITEFWVDRIKSKCVAKFEKEDEAFETRAALHGVRWPTSNPKTLQVDFTTEERLENLKERESQNDVKPKIEEKPQKAQILPVREWDLGKRERGGRSRSPSGQQRRRSSKSPAPDRKRPRRGSPESSRLRRKTRSPQRDRRGREGEAKKEPEPSGKALDELFRKTVAVPCIYWLPLNPQQISEKEELRRKRMVERERRISEMAAKLRSR